MKKQHSILILLSIFIIILFGCADTSSSSGSFVITGPVSGDNTNETKTYSFGDTFDFGSILNTGSSSKTVEFTLKNNTSDTVALMGSSPVVVNSDNSVYRIEGDQPSASLQEGQEVSFSLKFEDNSDAGTETGTLVIVTDDPDVGTFSLNITGTIMESGSIELWGPTSGADSTERQYSSGDGFDFSQDRSEFTFTIKNVGPGTLNLSAYPLSIGGADPAWFSITQQPLSTIPSSTEATFKIKYNYLGAYQTKNGTVTIESDDPDMTSFTLALTGYDS